MSANVGVRLAQPAVIPTRPPSTPFIVSGASGFPFLIHEITIAAVAAAIEDRNVLSAISATPVVPSVVEPALKPNHPNHRINMPSAASGRLCPGMCRGLPSMPYLPTRGPITSAPASAAHAPTECTSVEPAKSMKPSASSQPLPLNSPPHAHAPKTG